MKNIFSLIFKNGFASVIITVASGATILTSVAGAVKVSSNMNSFKPQVPEVKSAATVRASEPEEKSKDVDKGQAKRTTPVNPVISQKPAPTNPPMAPAVTASQNQASTTNANACIITLFGKQYDVAPLQSSHPGGNIFTCNTDMTATYQGKHGTDVSRMQPYLVTQGGSTSGQTQTGGSTSGGSTQTSTGTRIERDDDVETEHEDEEKKEVEKEEEHETENGSQEQGEF